MPEKAPIPDSLNNWAQLHGFDCSNINSRIENAMTPLMLAAMYGKTEIVHTLLAAGANANCLNDDDNNALWFACVSNHPELVSELLHHGININNQNVNGATCLIYCASTGKLDLVTLLTQAGADISRQTLDGFNALDSATTVPILKYLKPMYTIAYH